MNKLVLGLAVGAALCLGCLITLILTNTYTKSETRELNESLQACMLDVTKSQEQLAAACNDEPIRLFVCGNSINACLCEEVVELKGESPGDFKCTETGCVRPPAAKE